MLSGCCIQTCTFKKEVYKGKSCRVHGLGVKSSCNKTLKTPECLFKT